MISEYMTFVHIRIKFSQSTNTKSVFIYQISFLKINIEVIKETYTWIICHRTTVTNYAGHLKEIRLKTSSTHQTKTALKYMELNLGSIRATLASRVIGKVRTGLHKFCSVAGLASRLQAKFFRIHKILATVI